MNSQILTTSIFTWTKAVAPPADHHFDRMMAPHVSFVPLRNSLRECCDKMYHINNVPYFVTTRDLVCLDIGPKSKTRIHELLQTLNKTFQFYKPVIRNQGVEDIVTDIMEMSEKFHNNQDGTWILKIWRVTLDWGWYISMWICINEFFLLHYKYYMLQNILKCAVNTVNMCKKNG